MSSKIIVKSGACFHAENYSYQKRAAGLDQAIPAITCWSLTTGLCFFGASGNDRLSLLANIMPIIVSIVSALLNVAMLRGRWKRTAGTLSGTKLGMKSLPGKGRPPICFGRGHLPRSAPEVSRDSHPGKGTLGAQGVKSRCFTKKSPKLIGDGCPRNSADQPSRTCTGWAAWEALQPAEPLCLHL